MKKFSILLNLVFISLFLISEKPIENETIILHNEIKTEKPPENFDNDTLSLANVRDFIYDSLRLENPQIVLAQAILESGNFKSWLSLNSNNIMGMRHPRRRPTISKGTIKNHAHYNDWKDCLKDYAIWQSRFCKRLNTKEYYDYLDSVYAESGGYSGKLKFIVKNLENV